jgi:hypothetical protein
MRKFVLNILIALLLVVNIVSALKLEPETNSTDIMHQTLDEMCDYF